ncbi:MAG: MFS transporter [Anaerolineae bacterium]|jgi:MFS family permease
MKREIRWYDYITVNIYWLGLTTISQVVGLIYPLLVQRFVGEELKGTFFGTLRLSGLMIAVLVQALMGMLSDHSTLRWGRRRPFIFIGTVLNMILFIVVGLISDLEGMAGFWALFVVANLSQVASNTAHGAQQGFIPDLVPRDLRGRFSGVKAVLEVPIPVILVALAVAPVIGDGNLSGALLILVGVIGLVMAITMLVPEKAQEEPPGELDWRPFLRLVMMTALFTAVILGMGAGVKTVGRLIEPVDSTGVVIAIMGLIGLVAMAIAVGLGVWASVRISIGRGMAQHPSFVWWVINRLAFLIGTHNLSTFAVYFIQGRLGFAAEEAADPAGKMMMFVGIAILLSALLSGWLVDRFGQKRLLIVSGLVAALGTLILLLSPNMTVIYVGGCLVGLATGLFFTANWALGTSLVPEHEAGRYLGISNLAGAGAGAIGAYIGGPIADYLTVRVPDQPGLGYVLLFAIYGVLFLLSVTALAGVRSSRRESPLQP